MLEGYTLALIQGQWFIGKLDFETKVIEPAYEAHVRWMGDNQGNFGVLRECTPISGSTRFRSIALPDSAVCFDASEMSGKEREAWSNAIQECEGIIKALKVAESGLVLPPAAGALIK